MSLQKEIVQYIKQNSYEIIVTFCIFTNIFPSFFPSFIYYLGLGMIVYKKNQTNTYSSPHKTLFIALIILLLFSSTINITLDLRQILFIIIIFVACPIYTSYKWYLYKRKLLKNIFLGFAGVVIVSLYAKIIGYNHQTLQLDVDYLNMVSVHEFSGFAVYPMWISAASALSAIYFAYLLFKSKSAKWFITAFHLTLMISSIYITIISASRSALAISLGVIVLFFYWLTHKLQTRIKYITIMGSIIIVTLPFFIQNSTRMIQKQEYQKTIGKTSRDALWDQRLAEFNSSPIWGIGFAAHGTGLEKKVGRNESGGGWISILAQTGIGGVIIMLLIWKKAIIPIQELRRNKTIIPIYGIFIFFSLHSIFEGYMFQGGWYLCLIFWIVIGTLIEYKEYEMKKKKRKPCKM